MLLIGSAALHYQKYGSLKDFPQNKDIDVLCTKHDITEISLFEDFKLLKETKNSQIVKIKGFHNPIDFLYIQFPSDELLESKASMFLESGTLPFPCKVIGMHDLALVYLSSYETLKKEKYKNYYNECVEFLSKYERIFIDTRNLEITKRKEASFFHKYPGLSEYIRHDDLHEYVASFMKLEEPTYKKTLAGITKGIQDRWENLSEKLKITERVEETVVIYLERYYIPRCVRKNNIDAPLINDVVLQKIIDHVNVRGLRDQAHYITQFSNRNYFDIRDKVMRVLTGFRDSEELKMIKKRMSSIISKEIEPYYNGSY